MIKHTKLQNPPEKPGCPSRKTSKAVSALAIALIAVIGVSACKVQKGQRVATAPALAQMDQSFGTQDGADLIRAVSDNAPTARPDKVQICIHNQTQSGWNKGLHWEPSNKPHYLVSKGQEACDYYNPTNRPMYFWKAKTLGIMTMVGQKQFDFAPYRGRTIRFYWQRD